MGFCKENAIGDFLTERFPLEEKKPAWQKLSSESWSSENRLFTEAGETWNISTSKDSSTVNIQINIC